MSAGRGNKGCCTSTLKIFTSSAFTGDGVAAIGKACVAPVCGDLKESGGSVTGYSYSS